MGAQKEKKSFTKIRTTKNIKRFVWIFFILAILVTLAIFYQTLFKTTVTFVRQEYPLEVTFAATIDTEPTGEEIAGEFSIETVNHSVTSDELTESRTVSGKATGTIRVINTWSQDQPLQATTRFLAPDGTQFRTTERVDVPAGGDALVPVVADNEGSSGNIPANTKFTIPGLWQGLQDEIYGVNDTAFTSGERKVSLVTQDAIDALQTQALEEIDTKAEAQFTSTSDAQEHYVIRTNIISQQASAQAGDEAEQLTFAVKAEFLVLSVRTQTLSALAYDKLKIKITAEEQITRLLLDSSSIEVDRISTDDNSLLARFTVHAFAKLTEDATVFQPVYLEQKTKQDLQTIQEEEIGIQKISVSFSPFWSHTIPSDPSRIRVTIQ